MSGTGVPAMGQGARIACYVALVLGGLVVGLCGGLVQGLWFPLGLVVALAAAAGLFWGGGLLTRSKVGAVAPAAGWVAAVVWMTLPRGEGDFFFAAGVGSYVFLFGGMLVAVMCATLAAPAPLPQVRTKG